MVKVMKNLANLLGRTARNIAVVSSMAVPLVFAGCHEENYPPKAKLEVSPIYGEAPLAVRSNAAGTFDENGLGDIKLWELYSNNKRVSKRNYLMDTTMIFSDPGVYDIYLKVTDSEGQSDKTDPIRVEVKGRPFMEQSASLYNDVDIKYNATLSYVDKAELKVNKNGTLLLTEEVKDVNQYGTDYNKTFNYAIDGITKGNYEFVLKSYNLESKNSVVVPNYPPTINMNNTKIDLNEEADTTITLPKPDDKNPEDKDKVAIQYAKPLDVKTKVTLNGYDLSITALPGQTGPYQVEFEYGSASGGLEKKIIGGEIIKDMRIRVNPFIQPNDTTKPIIWNNFATINERNTRLDDRLYNYDKTDTITIIPSELVCTDLASIWTINFNGYNGLSDDPRGLFKNNLHNIPAYTITLMKPNTFHQIVGVDVKDNINFDSWRFIGPSNDSTYTKEDFQQLGVYKIVINYTYVNESQSQGKHLASVPMLEFVPDGNGGWKDSGYRNPEIKLITQRGK